jgi:hypothetical protein
VDLFESEPGSEDGNTRVRVGVAIFCVYLGGKSNLVCMSTWVGSPILFIDTLVLSSIV